MLKQHAVSYRRSYIDAPYKRATPREMFARRTLLVGARALSSRLQAITLLRCGDALISAVFSLFIIATQNGRRATH
eukprot:scaffold5579_cov49-Attheya_sp.AAC.2